MCAIWALNIKSNLKNCYTTTLQNWVFFLVFIVFMYWREFQDYKMPLLFIVLISRFELSLAWWQPYMPKLSHPLFCIQGGKWNKSIMKNFRLNLLEISHFFWWSWQENVGKYSLTWKENYPYPTPLSTHEKKYEYVSPKSQTRTALIAVVEKEATILFH